MSAEVPERPARPPETGDQAVDAVDLLRAACAAAWSLLPAGTGEGVDVNAGPVVAAVRRLEPGAGWAR